ncbi:MAG: 2-octaprenyl-6-methoxyphenyl hydroxylase [Xanthomonadales bacterium]
MNPGTPDRYDVAIIGGGLVGASLACALAPLGLKLALVEAVSFRASSQPSYDDRTLALSASSCQILKGLGIWPLLEDSATPIREIHVRELDRPGRVVLTPGELGLDRFGHVVEAREFGVAVTGILPKLENLDILCPASIVSLEPDKDTVHIVLDSEGEREQLEARLVVGADGAHSFIRESLGIETERYDYRQTAVICNITPEQAHRGRAFECFTPSGPFAVMPHVSGRCGLIWCVHTDDAAALLELPDQEFLRGAQARFGDVLGDFVKAGKRSSYPLRLIRAREDIRPGVVILGNAAHAIHPVGAQGFNLGLRDAAVLAEVLYDEICCGNVRHIGSIDVLLRYSELRAPDQQGTIAQSDGLARMFANPSPLAAVVRSAGLFAHALLPPLRRQLAVNAMGFRGNIPRLALGESLGPVTQRSGKCLQAPGAL